MKIVLIILVIVLVLLVAYFIATYNSMVVLRNRVKDQWSQIDVQLKRRFDLVPNLMETVKGYMKHESETLENVVKARNSYTSATTSAEALEADGELTKAISKLFALAESYPDLKANEGFTKMQDELSSTEDKIAITRQFYNDTVLTYNNKVQLFPANIVAGMFGFKTEEYFSANETERENVKVDFNK